MNDYKRWCDIIAMTPGRDAVVVKLASQKDLAKARESIMKNSPIKERAGIVARHKSARPKPENPAFQNTHHDLGRLIEIDDELISALIERIKILDSRA